MSEEKPTALSVIGQGAGMTAMWLTAAGLLSGFKAGGIGQSLQRGILGAVIGTVAGALIGYIGYTIAGSVRWAFRGAMAGVLLGTACGAIMSSPFGKPGIAIHIGWISGAIVGTIVAACIERKLRPEQTAPDSGTGSDDKAD